MIPGKWAPCMVCGSTKVVDTFYGMTVCGSHYAVFQGAMDAIIETWPPPDDEALEPSWEWVEAITAIRDNPEPLDFVEYP